VPGIRAARVGIYGLSIRGLRVGFRVSGLKNWVWGLRSIIQGIRYDGINVRALTGFKGSRIQWLRV
jgi:hypothetical protein